MVRWKIWKTQQSTAFIFTFTWSISWLMILAIQKVYSFGQVAEGMTLHSITFHGRLALTMWLQACQNVAVNL